MQSSELLKYITAGTILVGSKPSEPPTNLRDVLVSRLHQLDQHLNRPGEGRQGQLENVQLETAQECLHVISQIQGIISLDATNSPKDSEPPQEHNLLGTRDLAYIRTLMSITFNWAVKPLLCRVMEAIPTSTAIRTNRPSATLSDLTHVPQDYALLRSILFQLFRLILPNGVKGTLANTHITVTLIDRYLSDLLRPSICLGWLPKSLSSDSIHTIDDARPLVMQLISLLVACTSSQSILV